VRQAVWQGEVINFFVHFWFCSPIFLIFPIFFIPLSEIKFRRVFLCFMSSTWVQQSPGGSPGGFLCIYPLVKGFHMYALKGLSLYLLGLNSDGGIYIYIYVYIYIYIYNL